MPTYEYACEACGNNWEAEQRITADPLKDCPKCGAPKAQRLISGSRFLLKGGGWYADGYGSKSSSTPKSGSGDSKPSETKSETKSDAKSETKSDTKSETKSDGKSAASSSSD
jgi:putative FmdB family regulatory protein